MKRKFFMLLMMISLLFCLSACKGKTEQSEEIENHFGEVYLNTFNNPLYELSAEFEEDWIVYNEIEILESNGFNSDDVVLEEDVEVGDKFKELIAYDIDSDDGAFLYAEKLDGDTEVDFNAVAEEELSEQKLYLESVEYTDIDAKTSTKEFLGDERVCLDITAKLDGDNYIFSYIFMEKDNYLLTFLITSDDEAGVENILSAFEFK